ncbi:Protein-lysine N-methyltransferase EEF2KMT [Amphibalanus amphitrite]|uniref:Protein-lysine N-methyltransferase EEF2KMT n=1 Tax=Amphibalanus amphitrite TaxID=1232801 RepID=A0A6A4WHU7_AMPAM|nr:Protein-lysine N-methyltransferase EEF2KMT [Amphibalanus amphitrite]
MLGWLETTGQEVPELAYRLHSQLSSSPRAASTDGHVVYQLTPTVAVPVWENRCLLAADTTGLRTWQAGKALLDWYMLRPDGLKDRRVLELGAGLGLTGLALCRLCQPKSYIITDGHPLVVQMLKYNVNKTLELVKDNLVMEDDAACAEFVASAPDLADLPEASTGPPERDDTSNPGGDLRTTLDGTKLTVGKLDWFKFTAEDALRLDIDLVLTADVTYNPELHEPLVRTLRLLLDNVQPAPQVLLALTDRNEDTTARLMRELASQGLKQRLLATPANNQSAFQMDEMSKVKMFDITRLDE